MTKPVICNKDEKQPSVPDFCDSGNWEVPVSSLSSIKQPNRDHAYVLPDNSMWVLSHDGKRFVKVNEGGTSSSQVTQVKNTDGRLTISGSGTPDVMVDVAPKFIEEVQRVKSVNGKQGEVALTSKDIGLDKVNNEEQASKVAFDQHVEDQNIHITQQERKNWSDHISDKISHVSQAEKDLWTNKLEKAELTKLMAGEKINLNLSMDFKGKVAGSTKENPHEARRTYGGTTGVTTILKPDQVPREVEDVWYKSFEEIDNQYRTFNVTNANAIAQLHFKFNVIDSINDQYPQLFSLFGATTLAQKIVVVKSIVKRIHPSVWGMGSGASGNKLTLERWDAINQSWVLSAINNDDKIKQIQGILHHPIQFNSAIDDSGYLCMIAHAPASDGITPSIVNVDYTRLYIILEFSLSDIYATKEELQTEKQVISNLATGEKVTFNLSMDFKNKVAGSTQENPHFFGFYEQADIPSPDKFKESQNSDPIAFLGDNIVYKAKNNTKGVQCANVFKWDVITEIDRRYPYLFGLFGAVTLAQKTAVAVKIIKRMESSVWGYGHGAKGYGFVFTTWSGDAWAGLETEPGHKENVLTKARHFWTSQSTLKNVLGDEGVLKMVAHAPASDGVTPSEISIDYANLEIILEFSLSDIYALKSESVTKTEFDNLEIGTRNYIIQSRIISHGPYQTNPICIDNVITTTYVSDTVNFFTLAVSGYIPDNRTYILSGRMLINGVPVTKKQFINQKASTYNGSTTKNTFDIDTDGNFTFVEKYSGKSRWILHTQIDGMKKEDVITIENLTFQKGNKATEWTPAPEDMVLRSDKIQMSKVTADDGGYLEYVPTNTILSTIIAGGKGLRTGMALGNALVSDSPSTLPFRYTVNMTHEMWGYVHGCDESGIFWGRAIGAGKWRTEWKKLG